MTPFPLTISGESTTGQADELMQRASIRHLPVTNEQGEFIGVITDREVKTALLLSREREPLLKDLVSSPPYFVATHRHLDDVVFEMMEHRHSCAIVEDENGKIVGVFTEADALRAFHELLGDLYKEKRIWVA